MRNDRQVCVMLNCLGSGFPQIRRYYTLTNVGVAEILSYVNGQHVSELFGAVNNSVVYFGRRYAINNSTNLELSDKLMRKVGESYFSSCTT